MSQSSWDNSVRVFIEESASSQPTPGGGSVSAVVAALGAAMVSMVGNLSQGEAYASIKAEVDEVLRKMNECVTASERLFAEDINSFEQYMKAIKLPKGTDEEKSARSASIQAAAKAAIEVPLSLIRVCQESMQCAIRIAETSNKNVSSDLGVGAILFKAAAESAKLTVEINLGSIKDAGARSDYEATTEQLMKEIELLHDKTLSIVQQRIRG